MDVRVHHRLAGGTSIIQADVERRNSESARQLYANTRNKLPYCGELRSRQIEQAGYMEAWHDQCVTLRNRETVPQRNCVRRFEPKARWRVIAERAIAHLGPV